jgi:Methyltransferase domain
MDAFLTKLHNNAYDGLDVSEYTCDLRGWKYAAFDIVFREFIVNYKNPVIVEVGSWKGLSASTMAEITKEFHIDARIICIDSWIGSREFWLRDATPDMDLQLVHGYPSIFYTFTKNIKSSGHHDRVYPLPATSTIGSEILRHYDIQADVIYIDASHDYTSVYTDLTYYWNNLKNGGVMFGDDFNPQSWPGVCRAVEQFSIERNVRLYVSGCVWFFKKI